MKSEREIQRAVEARASEHAVRIALKREDGNTPNTWDRPDLDYARGDSAVDFIKTFPAGEKLVSKVEEQDGEQELPPPGVTKEDENEANRRLDNDDRAPSQYRLLLTILVARERQLHAVLRELNDKSVDSLSPKLKCKWCGVGIHERPAFQRGSIFQWAHVDSDLIQCEHRKMNAEPDSLSPKQDYAQNLRYATQIATYLHEHCYPEVIQWKPIPEDLFGVLMQIDNMCTGVQRKSDSLSPSEPPIEEGTK